MRVLAALDAAYAAGLNSFRNSVLQKKRSMRFSALCTRVCRDVSHLYRVGYVSHRFTDYAYFPGVFGYYWGVIVPAGFVKRGPGAGRLSFFMNIVDLRQTTVRQIESLLDEEAVHWREELHWDYRGALELIKRFLEAHALSGCVAYENGVAAGYAFLRIWKNTRGLIGGLYASPRFDQSAITKRMLEEMLFSMRAIPHVTRIEAQLMPFGGPVDKPLTEQGFRLYTRQFMLLDLHKPTEFRISATSRAALFTLARPLLRSLRKADLSRLRGSRGRRHQRPIPQ